MKKLPIKRYVEGMLRLEDSGAVSTMLGIGPMSSNLLQAAFELAQEHDFPLMFIASRNQVDADEFGAGYVNGWDQARFAADIKRAADEAGFDGMYYLCRDHGGPWQRDEERRAHLSEAEAMARAKASYLADIKAGFDLLMIDPTKDPFVIGKVIPLDVVERRTVELIEYCEEQRRALGFPEIGYEVGTEETNGGLTSADTYEEFIKYLEVELGKRGLPMPTFIVGQTGTLTRYADQVGHYNFKNAIELSAMAKRYGVGLKEHNADYMDDAVLLGHIFTRVTASNVAPQYGTEETRAYLNLCAVQDTLVREGLCTNPADLKRVLLVKAIETERWRKWMTGDEATLQIEDILADEKLSSKILDISGHYVFNDDKVKVEVDRLYANLKVVGIEGRRYVVDYIKRPIRQYVECLNLTSLTSRVVSVLE